LALADTLAAFQRLAPALAVSEGARAVFGGGQSAGAVAAVAGLELLLGVDGGDAAPWDDGLTTDGLSAEGRIIAERFAAMSGALKWVFRQGTAGWLADVPFEVVARHAPRVGDASMLAVGGLDAGVDPYLAAAVVLALVGDDHPLELAGIEDAAGATDHVAVPWLRAALGEPLVASVMGRARARLAKRQPSAV
jgi:hypothetical protein